jgi:hypothetical protein
MTKLENHIAEAGRILAGLCAEMLDGNCVGIYVPRERSFIPNDGSLLPGLRRIAFSQHHGDAGWQPGELTVGRQYDFRVGVRITPSQKGPDSRRNPLKREGLL